MTKYITAVLMLAIAATLFVVSVVRDSKSQCFLVVKTWESSLNNRDSQLVYRGDGYGTEFWQEEHKPVKCDTE